MPIGKKLTLLTPAVLHSTVLVSMQRKDRSFHKEYIVHFALLQGLWAVILFTLSLTLVVLPRIAIFRETAQKVILNANFSSFTIEDGKLGIAIKPAIWTFTLSDSESAQSVVVVDSTGSMNPYYWDDRVEKNKIKKINGIGFMEEYILIKKGTDVKKIPYTRFARFGTINMTKGELNDALVKYTSQDLVIKKALMMLPIVFVLGVLLGGAAHLLFTLIVGSLLALFSKKLQHNFIPALKTASALYVGWAYIAILSLVSYRILYLTLADLSYFFVAVLSIAFATLLLLGSLALTQSGKLKKGAST